MSIDINSIFGTFHAVTDKARLHAALFADVIAVIEESRCCRIHLRERSASSSDSQARRPVIYYGRQIKSSPPGDYTPAERIEYYIFLDAITHETLALTRFEVAHVLGHILLHECGNGADKNDEHVHVAPPEGGVPASNIVDCREEQELEADIFALLLIASKGKIVSREHVDVGSLIDLYKSVREALVDQGHLELITQSLRMLDQSR